MLILDEHVSRVWESPKQSPLRSPGPGYMRKQSPGMNYNSNFHNLRMNFGIHLTFLGSKSPDRAAKLMTNSYPFPLKSHNHLGINQVSNIFSKISSDSTKAKSHCQKSKPLPTGPPNPYRIPKSTPIDQPSTSAFQACLSPLVDRKTNGQQLWKSK